ncbi:MULTISPECIES: nuclear transport factor 2 family protein [unclassified Chelatococcus]|uniref:nuclear transport factor 2 family protein n=1 Tax=unclassified Chelatococcus TaxID=2638111 RepID=UPI001BD086B5|nr:MULTISPECIES: nuclear transport factor 2 family protein [unclassified Chelatococcus]CAH1649570.1 Ketosteroid isomerase-like protein [Hyphomicrobiales bacterium]MBS7739619.1 nuclear transport factor 2 family protein [Chelatococcus sp. HY11]MBX3543988.1 nuclear transport factor 2 family protein [Chelatococcus sp.]MCO5075844.1 nuclear transport factor 2 family protein [Chelatococcus sp.]CAH1667169.1 Ketosteroid isomerase-like protein [Hyphomicrobiales bacterium]
MVTQPTRLTRDDAIALLEHYFRRVDGKDMDGLMAILTEDCRFRIETDQLDHIGRDVGVRAMFERLFSRYATIWHGNFSWVFDAEAQRIACQLDVINTEPCGREHHKHNASFYHLKDGKIAFAGIYMSGTNALV